MSAAVGDLVAWKGLEWVVVGNLSVFANRERRLLRRWPPSKLRLAASAVADADELILLDPLPPPKVGQRVRPLWLSTGDAVVIETLPGNVYRVAVDEPRSWGVAHHEMTLPRHRLY